MAIIPYTLWETDGIALRDTAYPTKYLTPEKYISDNPLESLVALPGVDDFFGTKVLNIFIVSHLYGYNSSGDEIWEPDGYADALARHMATYHQFAKYETHVYIDMNIVNKIMEAEPGSDFASKMTTTKYHMEAMCTALADYGFTLEDDITEDVGPEFFYPIIDAFYGTS